MTTSNTSNSPSEKGTSASHSSVSGRGPLVPPVRIPERPNRRRSTFDSRIPDRRPIPRDQPRVFLLKWNNAHQKTPNQQKYIWHECWGTLYPNGRVTLDYGSSAYESMTDLREHVTQVGVYLFQWLTDLPTTLGPAEGTALNNEAHP